MDLLDRIAALSLGGNASFDALRAVYESNEGTRAPEEWLP
jgi:hypothetical protein